MSRSVTALFALTTACLLAPSGARAQSAPEGAALTPAAPAISDQVVGRLYKIPDLRVAPGEPIAATALQGLNLGLRDGPSAGTRGKLTQGDQLYIPGVGFVGATTDTDGDGLTDVTEIGGWQIVIDEHGYGPNGAIGLLVKRTVTSDPLLADTDGDGLEDDEEFLIGSDPRKVDTDGDGLDDENEWNHVSSNPNSVDSDADSRGPDANLIPNAALFDGAELNPASPRTSPTLADTDGDGRTDFEEVDHPFFSALIAELPTAALTLEGELDIRLDVLYEEAVGGEVAYETSLTSEQSSTSSTEMGSSSSKSSSSQWNAGASATVGIEGEAGLPPSTTVSAEATASFDYGESSEVSKSTQFTSTNSSTTSAAQTSSQYRSDTQQFTEVSATGSITVPFRVTNDSLFAYSLTNLGVTLLKFDPVAGASGGESFKAMGTITPDLPSITLAPGETTPLLTLDSGDLNPDVVKDFLADPSSLVLEPSIFDLQDQNGIDFNFITQNTFSQTALVEIDFGDGTVESYRVATNVERDGATYQGIDMGSVLTDILDLDYTVSLRTPNVLGTKAIDGSTGQVKSLADVGGVSFATSGPDVTAAWVVLPNADLDYAFTATEMVGPTEFLHVDFESIRLFAGDSIRLVYSSDTDGDGLWSGEEVLVGSDPGAFDTDTDGLNDFEEAKQGWVIGAGALNAGVAVTSDPRLVDTDFDGLDDAAEKLALTDPRDPDTDGDGTPDGNDSFPRTVGLRLYVTADGLSSGPGDSWAQALNLETAFSVATFANNDGDATNNISNIWVASGLYQDTIEYRFPTTGQVEVYGGFTVGDTKFAARDPNPLTNGTVIDGSLLGSATEAVVFRGLQPSTASSPGGVFDGFSIVGTSAERALWVEERRPVLRNLLIAGNLSPGGNSTGGLLISAGGSVVAENLLFSGNMGAFGGAVRDQGGARSTFTDCTFMANEAVSGGAYYKNGGSPGALFTRCIFNANRAFSDTFTTGGGGAVFTTAGGRMFECDFYSNRTQSSVPDSDYNEVFHARQGGAIYVTPSGSNPLTVVNSRFFNNYSGDGSAIYIPANGAGSATQPAVSLINSTFGYNVSVKALAAPGVKYGAIAGVASEGGGPDLEATVRVLNIVSYDNVLAGNSGTLPPSVSGAAVGGDANLALIENITDGDYRVDFSSWGGAGGQLVLQGFSNNSFDPSFVSILGGNLRLQGGSLLVDSGSNVIDVDAEVPGFQPITAVDLDGNPRIVDGNGFGATTIDRGAYEVQP